MTPAATFTAAQLAERLGKGYGPTTEQAAIIESPLEPALVIAGAGSGKTETMADRVVWLVANGLVKPSQILGLTFTRKAAGELGKRIRQWLALLGAEASPLDAPTVSTYNSFANTLFRESALLIGREPDGAVLTDSTAWQLADRVVRSRDDERLAELDRAPSSLVDAVLGIAHALADNHVAGTSAVREYVREFARVLDLPGRPNGEPYADVVRYVRDVAGLDVLLDLVEEFRAEKRRRGFVEFSDQVAFAHEAVTRAPDIAADYRQRFAVVLLDEYQDTSVGQTELLAALFRGHPVMAVGDPHQSIYGWRGASEANLLGFARDFSDAPAAVPLYSLPTSWRNPTSVLEAANAIAAPLRAESGVPVAELLPRPGAGRGSVEVVWEEDIRGEAARIAAWFQQGLADPALRGGDDAPPTAALLCRSPKKAGPILLEFDRLGIPYRVLGVGGLLQTPVITDLVSALKVLVDPGAGSELIRLLAGARWRIGAKDVAALHDLAGELERRDHRLGILDADVKRVLRGSVEEGESASIVDALDFLAHREAQYSFVRGFSEVGLERMRELGRRLARLRLRGGLPLIDLVIHVVQELDLDIELLANEGARSGRSALNAFIDVAEGYLAVEDESSSLAAFLRWLDRADTVDRLSPKDERSEPGTVQVLSIHSAKGLEWDLVAVPRLVADELPGIDQETSGWLGFGRLPDAFRKDHAVHPGAPTLRWEGATTQKEVVDAVADYRAERRLAHLAEERRLAYVAVTRAKQRLLLSGSFWATQQKPRLPSVFLADVQAAGLLGEFDFPIAPASPSNPIDGPLAPAVEWPHDPLGVRRERVERAAGLVASADPGAATEWDATIARLLAERDAHRVGPGPVEAPLRVPASRVKDYIYKPGETAAELLRPLPQQPFRQTRIGTLFHGWVEERSRLGGRVEIVDSAPGDLDGDDELYGGLAPRVTDEDAARLAALQETFAGSRWGQLQPVDVEIEVDLPLAGRVFICKLDAVYRHGDRYEVVDWKTGKPPARGKDGSFDPADLAAWRLQLTLYRLAYAKWKAEHGESVAPAGIDAVYYFVADDLEIAPPLYSEGEFVALWGSSLASGITSGGSGTIG